MLGTPQTQRKHSPCPKVLKTTCLPSFSPHATPFTSFGLNGTKYRAEFSARTFIVIQGAKPLAMVRTVFQTQPLDVWPRPLNGSQQVLTISCHAMGPLQTLLILLEVLHFQNPWTQHRDARLAKAPHSLSSPVFPYRAGHNLAPGNLM